MKSLESAERLLVVGVDFEDLLVGLGGAIGFANRRCPHRCGREPLLYLVGGLFKHGAAVHLDSGNFLPLLELDVDGFERVQRRKIRRIDFEELLPRVGRVVRLLQLGRVGFGQFAVRSDDLFRFEERCRSLDKRLNGLNQFERLVAPAPDHDQRAKCRQVLGIDVENALPGFESFVLTSECIAEETGASREHVDALFVRFRDVELTLQNVGKFCPAFELFVESSQRTERFRIFAAQFEHSKPTGDRVVDLPEMVCSQARTLAENLGLLGVARRVLEFMSEERVEFGPGLTDPVDALEGGDRILVCVVVFVDNQPEDANRIIVLEERLFVNAAQSQAEFGALVLECVVQFRPALENSR